MAMVLQTTFLNAFFLYLSIVILIKISLRFVPKGPKWHQSSIGSDNSLAPNRQQAIIWTNDD